MFGHFERPLFLELCKHMESTQVLQGQLLFSVGEPDDSIYVVQSGKLNVFVTDYVSTHCNLVSVIDKEKHLNR